MSLYPDQGWPAQLPSPSWWLSLPLPQSCFFPPSPAQSPSPSWQLSLLRPQSCFFPLPLLSYLHPLGSYPFRCLRTVVSRTVSPPPPLPFPCSVTFTFLAAILSAASELSQAKWDAFRDQCITEITPDLFNDAEDKMAIFSCTLLDIVADNIPKTSPFLKRKAKPWFDEDCQAAKKERNKSNRLANNHPSATNSMRARLIQAGTKKLFKQKKRDSWKNMYLQSMLIPL